MDRPDLVVLTGYPCSGKSLIANYMTEEFDYVRLSTDDFRETLYGKTVLELMDRNIDTRGEEKNNYMWHLLNYAKQNFLMNGFNVVIDSCAENNNIRKFLLSTDYKLPFSAGSKKSYIPVNRHLIYLDVDKKILTKRNLEKGRTNDVVSEWNENWEIPKEEDFSHTNFIQYENNRLLHKVHILNNICSLFASK